MKTLLFLWVLLSLSVHANAATIAVIDSGTDLNHQDLKSKKWINPIDIDDAVDNDDNGYIDDVNGWNFADSNNKLLDKSFLGTFSPDVYHFFEVQTRMLKGESTPEDVIWMQEARKNDKLIAELGTFGNFVHGTHVAGIVAKNADLAKVMVLKIIPTKSPTAGHGVNSIESNPLYQNIGKAGGSEKLIKLGLKLLSSQQGKGLAPIGKYVGVEKARIANCSFGTSAHAATAILKPILKLALKREPSEAEVMAYSVYFVSEVVKSANQLVAPAPKTLFVIAAGNDGMDNDVYPTSPANLKLPNTLSVAATLGYQKLASFSNYGEKMVDVAAPGVGILSSIPGNQYLTVSGTSQASPFVANVAGLAVDENPALSNSDLKRVLMETSDQKDFLKGKVVSGGIVNPERAILAARFSKTMQLSEAIQAALLHVNDVKTPATKILGEGANEGFIIPMPTFLQ